MAVDGTVELAYAVTAGGGFGMMGSGMSGYVFQRYHFPKR